MADETDPPASSPADRLAGIDENQTLGEILRREPGHEKVSLPPAVASMTAKEAKATLQGGARGVVFTIFAWLLFGAVGAMASLAIDSLLVHHPTGLAGAELWKAQGLLVAPYVVLAWIGGRILRRVQDLPKPQAWSAMLALLFALSRLTRFHWCGAADHVADAVMTRLADAALVFGATRLGFGSGAGRPTFSSSSDAGRFGPGPIEP